jgi:uncharacterized membrane protein
MLKDWIPLFLFLHVMGAIVAFGPGFIFPIIGVETAKAPQHGHFSAIIGNLVIRRVVLPLAVFQGVTGVLLTFAGGFDLLNTRWLLLGVILYAIALAYAFLVQAPTAARMVNLTEMPAGGQQPGPAGGPSPGGPPPELMATSRRLRLGGMFLSGMIVLIVLLMVTKPF